MWRRASCQLCPLTKWRSALHPLRPTSILNRNPLTSFHSSPLLSDATVSLKKTVDNVMPIATGLEREEIEAQLAGRQRFDMDAPAGPFGTKEVPAVIRSFFNKRIVGCPGGEGGNAVRVDPATAGYRGWSGVCSLAPAVPRGCFSWYQ